FDDTEQISEEAGLGACGRRRAAHVIEQLAVLEAVVGDALDLAVLVEIDRDNALVDRGVWHEGGGALSALRDVVEGLAADGGDRRRRAEHDQYLLLRGAERDLLQRSLGKDVAALIDLAETTSAEQQGG